MIDKLIKKQLIKSIIFTIMFLVGILLIIFHPNPFLFMLGIVFSVIGFYGMPISWVDYSNFKAHKNLCDQITNDHILDIQMLAKINNVSFDKMKDKVKSYLRRRYLTGYEIKDDNFLVPINFSKREKFLQEEDDVCIKICSSCGAKVELRNKKSTKCPYCDSTIV